MNLSTVSEKLQELRGSFARHANVCVSMANKVNVALLLFDDQMVELHSGRSTGYPALNQTRKSGQSSMVLFLRLSWQKLLPRC
jgi:hypothetical protein